ncbi:hypothetical protein [Blautia obeum]|uniref:hypothetical protein n=1 Tax=Blautia obeum TaxID=40520 RepID=UPI001FA9175D|nr:hypothetical protein [Blautia obeum]
MKKQNNQEENQSEKDKKHFSKLIGMPFRNPGSAYSSKRSSKGTSSARRNRLWSFIMLILVEMNCPQKEMDIFI